MHDKDRRTLKPILQHLEEQGAKVLETWLTKKGHFRLRVSVGIDEVTLTAPVAHGTEDPRAFRNWKSQSAQVLRRIRSQNTLALTEETRSSGAR